MVKVFHSKDHRARIVFLHGDTLYEFDYERMMVTAIAHLPRDASKKEAS